MCCTLELRQVIINPWISHAYSHASILKENHADHISSLNLTPTGGRMRCERWREGKFVSATFAVMSTTWQYKKGKKESGTRRSFFGDPLYRGLGDPADTLLITLLIMCTPFFDHSNLITDRNISGNRQLRVGSGYFFSSSISPFDFLSAHFPPSYSPVGTTYPRRTRLYRFSSSLCNIPTAE